MRANHPVCTHLIGQIRLVGKLLDPAAFQKFAIQHSIHIAGREVVRDDLIVLEQGDRIAGDAVLVEAARFTPSEDAKLVDSIETAVTEDSPQEASRSGSAARMIRWKRIKAPKA